MIDIKEFRKEVKLSQTQLAELLKCQQPNISRLEKYHADLTDEQYEILFSVYGRDTVLRYQIDLSKKTDKTTYASKSISFVNETMAKQNLVLSEIIKRQQEEIYEMRKEIELLRAKCNV